MKIAVPVANGTLCMHFGHCENFALVTVNDEKIVDTQIQVPPPHEPGLLPRWLKEQNADVIIAGGMGMRAQQIFQQYGIKVITGAPSAQPHEVVDAWLKGTLVCGDNTCDH